MRCVGVSSAALFGPDLPEATAQQGDDFLLNLRIVQQTQKRLFESLVLLCLLDLVFSFGSVPHRTIMPPGSSAKRPSAILRKRWRKLAPASFAHTEANRRRGGVDVKNSSGLAIVAFWSSPVV